MNVRDIVSGVYVGVMVASFMMLVLGTLLLMSM